MHDRPLPRTRLLLCGLLVLLAYVAAGYAAGHLLRQARVAPALALHAGIGLGAVLCWGWRMALPVGLGHGLLVVLFSLETRSVSPPGALGFAAGAMLQALVGAWLLRQALGPEPVLVRPREILLYVLIAGALTPLIGASTGVATLGVVYGLADKAQLRGIWVDFWLSNAIGLIIGSLALLALAGRPREAWARHGLNTALPLLLVALLLALVTSRLPQWEREQQRERFQQHAERSARALERGLQGLLTIMATTRGLLAGSPGLDARAFEAEARRFLREPGPLDAIALLKLRAGAAAFVPLYGAPDAAWARQAESALRPAVAALAGRPELPAASEAIAAEAAQGGSQVLLVQAPPASASSGAQASLLAIAFDPQALLAQALSAMPAPGQACLIDADPRAAQRRLAGPPGCEQRPPRAEASLHTLRFGARDWVLRVDPEGGTPLHTGARGQLIAGLATLGLLMLAVLLLNYSAHEDQIERLAAQRSSELRRTSQALLSHEQRFRSVFDKAPVGVCISALDGTPLEANPYFCRLLDCSPSELARSYRPHAAEDAELAHALAASGERSRQIRRSFVQLDGSRREAQLILSLLRGPEGKPEALLCIAEDITDQIQLEAHERAREAAELANRAKSEFLSRMSHELRTPLHGLLGFAQLLEARDEPLTDVQQGWVARIGQAGWHLLDMVDDILDLSLVESGELKISLHALDLRALVDEVLPLHRNAATRRGISLHGEAEAAGWVRADPTRLREILNNLLSNAVKYNRERGSVVLAVRQLQAGWLDISVRDTGAGLTREQLEALFQPFNRLGQERGSIEGTGIGLVISRRLAERMGGTLTVESTPGTGSVFTLRLPMAEAPAAAPAPKPAREHTAAGQARGRVIYIEDNAVNVEVMRGLVRMRPGLALTVHADGASGLAAVLAAPPDLLLLDMQLPDTDGLSLLEALRGAPQCEAMPVVVISADAMDEHIRQALAAGATHYVTKPYVLTEMAALLDRLLGHPPVWP